MAMNFVTVLNSYDTATLPVGNNVAPGTPVKVGGYKGICLTGSGDYKVTETIGDMTITQPANTDTIRNANEGTVALGGTALVPVAGVVAGTLVGTAVYMDATGDLSLTATGNELFGFVYNASGLNTAASCCVRFDWRL